MAGKLENFSNFPWKTERKVLGGEAREEKLEDRREDLGEEEGSEAEAGESHTLIRGEEASVRRTSSVLICDGWRIGK